MRNNLFLIQLLFIGVLLSSCGRQTAARQDGGDTLAFKYARRLTVVRHDGYTVATLYNPWHDGKVLHRYILVPRTARLENLNLSLHDGTVVRTPLRRSMVFTTVHCALLDMLGCQNSIAGVADLKYIKLPFVRRKVASGQIADVGEGLSPVVEKIIDSKPDAILLSPFENSGGYGRLEEIDIPIIECAEYMEPTPLGRAEWMRFYGMLFGCQEAADSLFAIVDSSYNALKKTASAQARRHRRPRVLLDKLTGPVWYVPGGRSTIGQMIADACGDYPWATDRHSGSVSLPFETVLERAGDADQWLFRYSAPHSITYSELNSEYHGYSQLTPVKLKNCYGCNVEQSLFYEETPFRPDRLLSDFISIFHSAEGVRPQLRYYQPVAK